ncbi:MAG: hypothetical protein ACF8TS_18985 [Maioricimonas sp. JB049]
MDLVEELRSDLLTPDFQLAIVDAVASKQNDQDETIAYRLTGFGSIDELAQSINAVVNDPAGTAGIA